MHIKKGFELAADARLFAPGGNAEGFTEMPVSAAIGNVSFYFDATFAELEQIISQMDSGELSLEDSVGLYERGRKLSEHCQALLDKAELRVSQLSQDGRVEPLT